MSAATAPSTHCPVQPIAVSPGREIRTIGDTAMADHGEVEYATATGNDYAEHEGTYRFFLRAVKWSVTVVVLILIGMAIFLT
jgi:hypothetical protein